MNEVSNSVAGLSIFGTNPLLVDARKAQARASRPVRATYRQAPSVVLVRTIHQLSHAEDRAWAILALAALVVVAMSIMLA